MNNEILYTILSVLCTAVILPLLTFAGNKLIILLNSKIKNEKHALLIKNAINIVDDSVKCVLQTYVSSLKEMHLFDEEAQKNALNKAKEIVLIQLTDESKKLINDICGNFDFWITTQIEASVHTIKNMNK